MLAREKVLVHRAMQDPDQWVIQMRYVDKQGVMTERIVSPIRWINGGSVLALCLCKEMPRRFDTVRCTSVKLVEASEVLMPVRIRYIDEYQDYVERMEQAESRELCAVA